MDNIQILMNTAEVKNEDDIRALFSVDASFVNLDGNFYAIYDEEEVQEVPFDSVLKRNDWKEDLENVIYLLGAELLDFDGDFQHFEYKIVDIDGRQVVSVVFGLFQN